jgi:4-hydroxy-tetrahydrodipicolinate synthase
VTPLAGVIVPLVAPLTEGDELDEKSLRKIVAHGLRYGVHGFFALGANSEFAGLTDHDRRRFVECVVDEVSGRVPVYVNVGECSLKRTRESLDRLWMDGVTAVAVLVPWFFASLCQEDLVDYYRAIDRLGRPFVVYEGANPRVPLDVETVRTLSGCANVIGLKVEDGRLVDQGATRELPVAQGAAPLIRQSFEKGAVACVTGLANFMPDVLVMLYDAHRRGDRDAMLQAERAMLEIREAVVTRQPSFVAGIKAACEVLGLASARTLAPHPRVGADGRDLIVAALRRAGRA